MVKAIYFDLDDTLINTSAIFKKELEKSNIYISKAIKSNVEEFKNIDLEEIYNKVRDARKKVLKKYSSNYDKQINMLLNELDIKAEPQIISAGVVGYHKAKNSLLSFDELLYNYLNNLQKKYSIGILSSGIALKQWDKINYVLGPDQPFFSKDNVLISDEFGIGKSSSKIFLEMVKMAGCKPSELVYVGDRYDTDITGASKEGIKTVFVNNPNNKYYLKDGFDLADQVVDSVFDIDFDCL